MSFKKRIIDRNTGRVLSINGNNCSSDILFVNISDNMGSVNKMNINWSVGYSPKLPNGKKDKRVYAVFELDQLTAEQVSTLIAYSPFVYEQLTHNTYLTVKQHPTEMEEDMMDSKPGKIFTNPFLNDYGVYNIDPEELIKHMTS